MRRLVPVLAIVLSACVTGGTQYTPPLPRAEAGPYAFVVGAPVETTWTALMGYAAESFFVIDNLEKDSRFLNFSFSASDPTQYIDCGMFESSVTNARGPRSYSFKSASAFQRYEITANNRLYGVERTVGLTGKVNLLLVPVGADSTRIQVNARYVVTREATVAQAGKSGTRSSHDTFAFSTGESGSTSGASRMECHATLALEHQIANGIAAKLSPPLATADSANASPSPR